MTGNNEGSAATENGNSNDGKPSDRAQNSGNSSNNKSNNSGTKQYHRKNLPHKTRNNHRRAKNHQTNQGGGNEAATNGGGGGASSSHKSNRNKNRTNNNHNRNNGRSQHKQGGNDSNNSNKPMKRNNNNNSNSGRGRSNGGGGRQQRGRGRGHRPQHHHRLRIFSSLDRDEESDNSFTNHNGFSKLHNECRALRYKVYKPQSEAPKLLKLLNDPGNINELDTNIALLGAIIKPEDDKNNHQDKRLIDALVVLPDTKQKFLYVCHDTSLPVFANNPRQTEKKLRDEIFSNTPDDDSQFKVSCASCLLTEEGGGEPNGFCVVASSDESLVDAVRDLSLQNQRQKLAQGINLHPDHAHFCATLPRSVLWKLYRSKTRAQSSTARDELFEHLAQQQEQTVNENVESTTTSIDFTDTERFADGITLGHHLQSVLSLATASHQEESYWLVMGYDDGKSIELDLPGGKRHLGESCLEGAIRETEEETSLIWDSSWITSVLQSKKKSDAGNRYFVLHPPPSLKSQTL